jgi:7,8-dihydropterin-6-yl-methyl-4-(beta-D-ribofuranosyl)aminobenzene 5'-phosphate synthase
MKLIPVLFISIIFSMTATINAKAQTDDHVTFSVIYDNYKFADPYIGDWGFSCLIEGKDKTILFDTGTKPDVFRKNLENLKVDINKIDLIVISHNHGDHTGGLPVILEKRKDLPVYIPASVEQSFLEKYEAFEGHTIPVSEPVELCEGVHLTGEMGSMIKEQSLLVETPKGLVIVTGCSHQGVDNIVTKATELSDEKIYLLFGGFHLLRHTEKEIKDIIDVFLNAGVQKCGASHCTGEEAIIMIKEVYGENFVTIGAGNKIVM